jgi:transposase-like protein
MYRGFKTKGFKHEYVDHDGGEYVRGEIHTNNIEGFWGILKRKLGCIGGIRRNRLHLFIAEIVWKFNHKSLSLNQQEKLLLGLVIKFGGLIQ